MSFAMRISTSRLVRLRRFSQLTFSKLLPLGTTMLHLKSMPVPMKRTMPSMALNLAPFGRWTLRDKAAQHWLALRWASDGN